MAGLADKTAHLLDITFGEVAFNRKMSTETAF
jgi:hypothetical protein